MTLNGPHLLAALDEALRDIRREEDEIMRKLARSAERVAKFRETEGELLRRHAEERAEPGRVKSELAAIDGAVAAGRDALRQRSAEIAAGAERLAELEAEQTALTAQRAAALADVDRQQAALAGLSGRITQAIAREGSHEAMRQAALRLRDVAAAAEAKARQAELEREQKLNPYRADPLFAYLKQRQFGTANYKERGIIAALDGWVSGLIRFPEAARSFGLIETLPAALRAHAATQASAAAAADAALDAIERQAVDAAGGATVRGALEAAQARIAAIDTRLLELQEARNGVAATQRRLATTEDAALGSAIDGLVAALGGSDLAGLIQAARGGVDETRAAQLEDARQRIAEEKLDTAEQQARLTTLAARRRELEDIEYELKALKFDDPRSLFGGDDLTGATLDEFLTGGIDADAYWRRLRQAQAWSAGTAEWGGGLGLPRHERHPASPPDDAPVQRPRATASP